MGTPGAAVTRVWTKLGGYSPLRRAFRRFRPGWVSRLSPAGREIWRFTETHGLTVLKGPLRGLTFPESARGHADFLAAKVLGAYESELHDALDEVIRASFQQVVDIGAGEGYYVVGLARRMDPGTAVVSFELDHGDRARCDEMAVLNDVARQIVQAGECNPDRLRATLRDGAFVLCDCEGYERDLLQPELVPQLRTATMLVELHPTIHADIESVIQERFSSTHELTMIRMRERDRRQYRELDGLPERAAYLILSEGWWTEEQRRAFTRAWAYMKPLQSVQAR
jgi:hypothetical protein